MTNPITTDGKAIVARLNRINKKLCCLTGTSSDCGCDCSGLDVNVDFAEVIAAINNLNVENENNLRAIENILCTQDCQSISKLRVYNNLGETVSLTYTFLDGTPFLGDINTLDPTCSKCTELGEVSCIKTKTICKVDDVNGDGSSLVPYEEEKCLSPTGIWTTIGTYRNCVPYPVQNEVDPVSAGLPPDGKSGRYIISPGGKWSPSSNVLSYFLRMEGTAPDLDNDTYINGATYTDSFGRTTNLPDGDRSKWEWDGITSDGVPIVCAGTKSITVTYTSK